MLEIIFFRKLLIYVYADQTLKIAEASRGKIKSSRVGTGKIKKYLPELEQEITTCWSKISVIANENGGEAEIHTDPE
jgi:hypothetical protein